GRTQVASWGDEVVAGLPFGTTLRLFFFQAEDGIRDLIVTGVQTCALPISSPMFPPAAMPIPPCRTAARSVAMSPNTFDVTATSRSEERRVGKECRSRWAADR